MNSVLIDTNVWVDIALKRTAFYNASMGCILACVEENIPLYIVGTSLKDVFYWVEKSVGAPVAYQSVSLLLDIAKVAVVDEVVCKAALELERPDYEDGIVAACARAEQVSAIVSRDEAAFNNLSIKKFMPAQLLEELGYEPVVL